MGVGRQDPRDSILGGDGKCYGGATCHCYSALVHTAVTRSLEAMISSGTFPEIARWWRREKNAAGRTSQALQDDDRGDGGKPVSTDPRTLLLSVTR